jgi:uncharacterized protein (TIGR03000 family)
MNRYLCRAALAAAFLLLLSDRAWAYGRGGGFHAAYAAGGFHAGAAAGGFHAAAAGGGFHAAYAAGGFHAGTYGGGHAAAVGAYHVGGVGANHSASYGVYRGGAVGTYGAAAVVHGTHVGLGTDFGFGHVVAGVRGSGFVVAGHSTAFHPRTVLASRGAFVRSGFYHYGAFSTGWWTAHAAAWRPPLWGAAATWGLMTWPALAGWYGWSASPIYFDYGNSIAYEGDEVYVDSMPVATAEQYYMQAADLAQLAPPAEGNDEEWKALGVFALVQGEQSNPSAFLQLAINKAGTLRGNYFDQLTNSNLPLRGEVDPKTQRVAWIVGDNKMTVYDTGIYNLTMDQAPLLIHFDKERTQQYLLVRIREKDQQAPPEPPAPAPAPAQDQATTAQVTVLVPEDAEVFFDGERMTQTGTERSFVTPPLAEGMNYRYDIRARWTVEGTPVEQTRRVSVRAGASVRVDFSAP